MFLKKLHEIIGDGSWQITVKKNETQLTLAILPKLEEDKDSLKPIVATGTPEELDEHLPAIIAKAKEKLAVLSINTEAFDESVDEEATKDKKKASKGKSPAKKSSPAAKKEVEKEEEEEEAKEEKLPKDVQQVMERVEKEIKGKNYMMAKFLLKELKKKYSFATIDNKLEEVEKLDSVPAKEEKPVEVQPEPTAESAATDEENF